MSFVERYIDDVNEIETLINYVDSSVRDAIEVGHYKYAYKKMFYSVKYRFIRIAKKHCK